MPRKTDNPDRLKIAQGIYHAAQEAKARGDLTGMAARLNELGEALADPPKGLKDLPSISSSDAIFWDQAHTIGACALAEGMTQEQAAVEAGVTSRTIRNWLQNIEFSAEVDRLSLMLGIAGRAERLRIAKRVIRQKATGSTILTDKDVLDWLKFAQSETDGAKIDFGKLFAALGTDETSVADSGQDRARNPNESTAIN